MTIKEIEEKTGMSRANIRFYEAEGLVFPERRENGYRVYSENDLQSLLRIKLLRLLDISLEDIKALQSGKTRLEDTLIMHLETLTQKQSQLEKAHLMTRELLAAGEEYALLDARQYLRVMEGETAGLKEDVSPRMNLPWRRYWARFFDLSLYNSIVSLLLRRFVLRESLTALFTLAAMVLTEPLLLRLFGTTPGKAIFGIRITDPEEGKLGYGEGLERTWMVLWEGMALNIPLVGWYFQYKSLITAENGEPLSWERDSDLMFKDDKMWRYGVYAAAYFGLLAVNIAAAVMGG